MDRTYLLINFPWLLGSGGTLFFDFTVSLLINIERERNVFNYAVDFLSILHLPKKMTCSALSTPVYHYTEFAIILLPKSSH